MVGPQLTVGTLLTIETQLAVVNLEVGLLLTATGWFRTIQGAVASTEFLDSAHGRATEGTNAASVLIFAGVMRLLRRGTSSSQAVGPGVNR